MEENRIIKNENTKWQCLNLRGGGILCSIAGRDVRDGVDLNINKVTIMGHTRCNDDLPPIGNKKIMVCHFDDEDRRKLLGEEVYELENKVFSRLGDVENYP